MMSQHELFRAVKDQVKQGGRVAALGLLRDALRRGRLDAEGIDRAGRLIRQALLDGHGGAGERPLRILVLGQVTTSWLVPALSAVAWGHNAAVRVDEGG